MTAWINRCVESCLGQVSLGPLIPSQTSVWSIHLHETGRVHYWHLLTPSNGKPPVPFSSICPFSLSYLCQRRGICQKTQDKNKPERMMKGAAILKQHMEQFKGKVLKSRFPATYACVNYFLITSPWGLPFHPPECGPWEKCSICRECDSKCWQMQKGWGILGSTESSRHESKAWDLGTI